MSESDFRSLVEIFRTLKIWRDEAEAKRLAESVAEPVQAVH